MTAWSAATQKSGAGLGEVNECCERVCIPTAPDNLLMIKAMQMTSKIITTIIKFY
jgi:hypothetical protein